MIGPTGFQDIANFILWTMFDYVIYVSRIFFIADQETLELPHIKESYHTSKQAQRQSPLTELCIDQIIYCKVRHVQ